VKLRSLYFGRCSSDKMRHLLVHDFVGVRSKPRPRFCFMIILTPKSPNLAEGTFWYFFARVENGRRNMSVFNPKFALFQRVELQPEWGLWDRHVSMMNMGCH
jgi:hypothetical protein